MTDDGHTYRAGYCPVHGPFVGYGCLACGTDNLIEQARRWNGTGSALATAELFLDLADALEDLRAERDALADALLEIRDHDPKTCRGISANDCLEWAKEIARAALAALHPDPNRDTRP